MTREEREEQVRERVNDLVMTLFDAADLITSVEDDGAGSLEDVFDTVKGQMEHINEVLSCYIHADNAYNLSLQFEDEDEDEDEDEEEEEEEE